MDTISTTAVVEAEDVVEEATVVEEEAEAEAVAEATTIITEKNTAGTTASKTMTYQSAIIQNRIISGMRPLPT